MNPPHNKLVGRKYSSQPDVGIPLALEILNNSDSHRNDILSATCYLGYRTLDGSYNDIDFIWEKIQYCRNWSLEISAPDADWFRTRWVVSYIMLSIYFKVIILKESLPEKLITEMCDMKYILSHPPQFVNILRGCSLMAIDSKFKNNVQNMQKYLDLGINFYRTAILNYIIDESNIDHIVYESGEAIEALNVILEIKYANSNIYDKFLDKWKPKTFQESRGPFFKSLTQVYHNNFIT
jgi:hypothetical protein